MGGFGSGRHSGTATCESAHKIDLAWLRRNGMLTPGRRSRPSWSWLGDEVRSIALHAQHDGVRLTYRTQGRDGAPLDIDELVPFAYTATRFGGRRQWLACLNCGRRCRVIYGGRLFRCRLCYGLRYASQSEPYHERAYTRADRIRKRLCAAGGYEDDGDTFPPKPPRMRWATYQQLEDRYHGMQDQGAAGLLMRMGFGS